MAAPPPLPRVLLVAAAVVALQGVALVLVGLGHAVRTTLDEPEDLLGSAIAAVGTVLAGVALLACAAGLRGRRAWARGPVLAVELVALPVGYQLLYVLTPVGVVVLVGAVTVLGLLLHPATGEALHTGR